MTATLLLYVESGVPTDHGIATPVSLILIASAAFLIPVLGGRIKIPAIVLEIFFGILVGPVLGIIEPGEELLGFLAEFGLFLLMFLAGFEIDFGRLERQGPSQLISGLALFALFLGAGWIGTGFLEGSAFDQRLFLTFLVAGAALAPVFGEGWLILSTIIACALLGMPLFALIGVVTIVCFLLWPENDDPLVDLNNLVERINGLADSENLLAVPLFMLSGSIMARGEISSRLIDFSKALIGWLPGGLAVSAVVACMLFAAISGSSPATVVAIGAMMAPTLMKRGYPEEFTHGLLTSSGSLGILIPPSIPMILYPLINQRAGIDTSELFAAGFGPGLVIGGILAGFCVYQGFKSKTAQQSFSVAVLGASTRDGFWSLMFPILILGGIYTGFFTVVEASAVSVVYAVVIEVFVHRALDFDELPSIVTETGIILGSLLVIMVSALAFSEFLHFKEVPDHAVDWIESLDLAPTDGSTPIAFLLILNVLLLKQAAGTLSVNDVAEVNGWLEQAAAQ